MHIAQFSIHTSKETQREANITQSCVARKDYRRSASGAPASHISSSTPGRTRQLEVLPARFLWPRPVGIHGRSGNSCEEHVLVGQPFRQGARTTLKYHQYARPTRLVRIRFVCSCALLTTQWQPHCSIATQTVYHIFCLSMGRHTTTVVVAGRSLCVHTRNSASLAIAMAYERTAFDAPHNDGQLRPAKAAKASSATMPSCS